MIERLCGPTHSLVSHGGRGGGQGEQNNLAGGVAGVGHVAVFLFFLVCTWCT